MDLHPTAIIHPRASIGEGTRVGAYSIIGETAVIGKNCDIQEHVVIRGHVRIGNEVKVFPGAVIGAEPQHRDYKGEPTEVEVGDRAILRECVTVHRGTSFGNRVTRIGDEALIMAYSHVAHDCTVGKNVILANACQLGGHVTVEDFAFVGGLSGVIQFCRVGRYSYVGGGTLIRKDLPPFVVGKGNPLEIQGINVIGLSRQGFSKPTIDRLRTVFKIFYLQKLTVNQAIEKVIVEVGRADEVELFVNFVANSKLGIER